MKSLKRNIQHHLFFAFLALVGSVLLAACASRPRFSGKGDLCGLVVDENNHPVADYVVSCGNNFFADKSAVTNASGIFVIYDVPGGLYKIKGSKKNFLALNEEYLFNDRSKIFCCQVQSIDSALKSVNRLIMCGNFQEGLEVINHIGYDHKSPPEKVIKIYKKLLKEKILLEKKE